MVSAWSRFSLPLFAMVVVVGCGGDDKKGDAGEKPRGDSGADVDAEVRDGDVPDGDGALADGGGDADATMPPGDPCEADPCGPGQSCQVEGDARRCTDRSCADLQCPSGQRCAEHAMGGHVCEELECTRDLECSAEEYCSDNECRADVCTPGVRRCDGQQLFECSDSGGQDQMRFSCDNASYFESQCTAGATGEAACTCSDDWDCPRFTVCEVGSCQGTGTAPSCSLPATPFSDTQPAVEFHWGGDSRAMSAAHDGTPERAAPPWAAFSQVVNTPMVANLDDDNGDGLINELDFPEIVFITHKGDNPWKNGIVRAVHGGGPNKGRDYFARCATKLWNEGMTALAACGDTEPDADSGAPVAIGDLDNDGVPEIVYTTERDTETFRILDNKGALLYTLLQPYVVADEFNSPSIANLDLKGYAEIIIGHTVYVLGDDGNGGIAVTHILTGMASKGRNGTGSMSCAADVIADMPGLELAAGATLYRMPATLSDCVTKPCTGSLEPVWNAKTLPGGSALSGEGYCAVADVWGPKTDEPPGPNNKPDGKPEIILIDNGELTILNGQNGVIITDRALAGGDRGGAPNVDDFDGDGFMEVASALQNFYVVVDFQASTGAAGSCPDWPAVITRKDMADGAHNPNPDRLPGGSCMADADCDPAAVCNRAIGRCVCLHNGWKRDSDDDSSRVTSSSVFDFNGDGAAEAIYNDECDFRVYEGTTGEVLFSQPSRSRTGIENPVVADVDNDGNAEVVTGMNTAEYNRCDDDPLTTEGMTTARFPTGPNGIRVWGDPTDTWVSARRIWNQQSYHVTNVLEGGGIPTRQAESWKEWSGRLYNTYRSQPRSFGVAPDLTVVGVGVSSPDAKCGSLSDNIDIAFEIENAGDLRVGPGVVVRFFGTWGSDEQELKAPGGSALELVLTQSLEPGRNIVLEVNFHRDSNGASRLPDSVRVVIDPPAADKPSGAERECREDNNSLAAPVDPGSLRADLAVEIEQVTPDCPNAKVKTKVRNLGSAPAENVVVRFYAGDPGQGGTLLKDEPVSDTIAPESEVTIEVTLATIADRGAITLFAEVDPERKVDECNEANNRDDADAELLCVIGPQ